MNKLIPVLLGCLLVAGCDNHSPGRYQAIAWEGGILRFDTRTGELAQLEAQPTTEELAKLANEVLANEVPSRPSYQWVTWSINK